MHPRGLDYDPGHPAGRDVIGPHSGPCGPVPHHLQSNPLVARSLHLRRLVKHRRVARRRHRPPPRALGDLGSCGSDLGRVRVSTDPHDAWGNGARGRPSMPPMPSCATRAIAAPWRWTMQLSLPVTVPTLPSPPLPPNPCRPPPGGRTGRVRAAKAPGQGQAEHPLPADPDYAAEEVHGSFAPAVPNSRHKAAHASRANVVIVVVVVIEVIVALRILSHPQIASLLRFRQRQRQRQGV